MSEHFDVVVVGAGISGISAAYHLQTMCPDRTFTILDGRDDIGGTWDLFRYPGIRSDSDMHTFGFKFKPWTNVKAIADGDSILEYLNETVDEFDIRRHIRFGHQVSAASWSSDDDQWTLTAEHQGEEATITAGFVLMCSGYYNYRHGYTPDFPGQERFQGTVVHPQQWPDDFDYDGKKVVVIGSGATAVTLIPNMADTTQHITMLQRSPTWMVSRPEQDKVANALNRLLPDKLAYKAIRGRNTWRTDLIYQKSRTEPEKVGQYLLDLLKEHLPEDEIEKHFTPTYNPWDQRLCLVPDGDFFTAIREGRASVVTDTIDTWTETGIQLESGEHLDADIIITATGLELVTIGDMDFDIDGEKVDFADRWTYKGMTYSDIPNLVSVFGYINASWTLRADLTNEYACRLLNHMRDTGAKTATARLRESDADMPERPWIDDFPAGYMQRAMALMPKQGDREPWLNTQRFKTDKKMVKKAPLDDGVMTFA